MNYIQRIIQNGTLRVMVNRGARRLLPLGYTEMLCAIRLLLCESDVCSLCEEMHEINSRPNLSYTAVDGCYKSEAKACPKE